MSSLAIATSETRLLIEAYKKNCKLNDKINSDLKKWREKDSRFAEVLVFGFPEECRERVYEGVKAFHPSATESLPKASSISADNDRGDKKSAEIKILDIPSRRASTNSRFGIRRRGSVLVSRMQVGENAKFKAYSVPMRKSETKVLRMLGGFQHVSGVVFATKILMDGDQVQEADDEVNNFDARHSESLKLFKHVLENIVLTSHVDIFLILENCDPETSQSSTTISEENLKNLENDYRKIFAQFSEEQSMYHVELSVLSMKGECSHDDSAGIMRQIVKTAAKSKSKTVEEWDIVSTCFDISSGQHVPAKTFFGNIMEKSNFL
eukprot:g1770.t1